MHRFLEKIIILETLLLDLIVTFTKDTDFLSFRTFELV